MSSIKPYIIRAYYDWIVDNGLTPYILVDASHPLVSVPQEFVADGRIILDISPNACRGFSLDNHLIKFTARFSGLATDISLHPGAVFAIYAKENNCGTEFEIEYPEEPRLSTVRSSSADEQTKSPASSTTKKKPTLKLIKNDNE